MKKELVSLSLFPPPPPFFLPMEPRPSIGSHALAEGRDRRVELTESRTALFSLFSLSSPSYVLSPKEVVHQSRTRIETREACPLLPLLSLSPSFFLYIPRLGARRRDAHRDKFEDRTDLDRSPLFFLFPFLLLPFPFPSLSSVRVEIIGDSENTGAILGGIVIPLLSLFLLPMAIVSCMQGRRMSRRNVKRRFSLSFLPFFPLLSSFVFFVGPERLRRDVKEWTRKDSFLPLFLFPPSPLLSSASFQWLAPATVSTRREKLRGGEKEVIFPFFFPSSPPPSSFSSFPPRPYGWSTTSRILSRICEALR